MTLFRTLYVFTSCMLSTLLFFFIISKILATAAGVSPHIPHCTFEEVAGPIPIELNHLVSFITESKRLSALGAHKPKGILLVGKPGTGKTLLVRALAGETQSHFLYASGSDFIELYVGNGAKKVRELFQKARTLLKPNRSWTGWITTLLGAKEEVSHSVIIFIDEIDALGNRDQECTEHRQTINQLLSCMDGFDQDEHITVIAVTNAPKILDKALKRSGRFDYIIEIPLPDQETRKEILTLHCNSSYLSPHCSLDIIAKKTNGLSGADLKLIANEAALQAVLSKSNKIEEEHFVAALKKVNQKKNQE